MTQNLNFKNLDKIDSFTGKYYFLSNFFCSPMHTEYRDGEIVDYPTVEHYFQAMKTKNKNLRKKIASCKTPGEAKQMGRHIPLRKDWEYIKDNVMYSALVGKFQWPDLRIKLLETGNSILIEGNTWHDNYWGSCKCNRCRNRGSNTLGRLLMQVRQEIIDGTSAPLFIED